MSSEVFRFFKSKMDSNWHNVYKPLVDIIVNSPTSERSNFIANVEEIAQKLLRTTDYTVQQDPNDNYKKVVRTSNQGKPFIKSYTEPALIRSLIDRWRKETRGDPEELAEVLEDFGLLQISASIQNTVQSRDSGWTSPGPSRSPYRSPTPSTSSRYTPSPSPELQQSPRDSRATDRVVGKISYNENEVLGEGSNGRVFKGTYGPRIVAIKTINVLPTQAEQAEKEIKILLACDDHLNIVKYYGEEMEDMSHVNIVTYFLAIELCHSTLKEWMERRDESLAKLGLPDDINLPPLKILNQVAKGLDHLHERQEPIIHRDLKPENILLQKMTNSSGKVLVKLTDFGISRVIPENKTHATLKTSSGTLGWMAPEVLKNRFHPKANARLTKQTDIFSLGCVFYYVLTGGGLLLTAQPQEISEYMPTINTDNFTEILFNNYTRLIRRMISLKAEERPSIKSILHHHIFWSNEKTLQFIGDASSLWSQDDWRDMEEWIKENHEKIYDSRISNFAEIFSSDVDSEGWLGFLTLEVRAAMSASKKMKNVMRYKGKSVRELVRAIRNLKEHYNEQKDIVKKELGIPPDNYLKYWLNLFPFLVDLVWTAGQSQNIGQLEGYYKNVDYDFSKID